MLQFEQSQLYKYSSIAMACSYDQTVAVIQLQSYRNNHTVLVRSIACSYNHTVIVYTHSLVHTTDNILLGHFWIFLTYSSILFNFIQFYSILLFFGFFWINDYSEARLSTDSLAVV